MASYQSSSSLASSLPASSAPPMSSQMSHSSHKSRGSRNEERAPKTGKMGKFSARGVDGKVLLVAPWFPAGVPKTDVTLRDEVDALGTMLQLTSEEQSRRHLVRSTVQDALRSIWPDATVKVYGSFAYNVSLPTSAVDLLVEGLGGGLDQMDRALERLTESGVAIVNQYRNNEMGYAKIQLPSVGISAQISFVRGASTARKSVSHMRGLLSKFPQAKLVFSVARLALQQARCGDATAGGLSSYALLIMVLTACYSCPQASDPTVLLMHFFRFYGEATTALFVEDPLHPENNLADGCVRWPQIRSIFNNSVLSLERWCDDSAQGYRGRSPLSSILAYDDLWASCRPGQVQFLHLPSVSVPVPM